MISDGAKEQVYEDIEIIASIIQAIFNLIFFPYETFNLRPSFYIIQVVNS